MFKLKAGLCFLFVFIFAIFEYKKSFHVKCVIRYVVAEYVERSINQLSTSRIETHDLADCAFSSGISF